MSSDDERKTEEFGYQPNEDGRSYRGYQPKEKPQQETPDPPAGGSNATKIDEDNDNTD